MFPVRRDTAHGKCCASRYFRLASFAQLAPRSDCGGGAGGGSGGAPPFSAQRNQREKRNVSSEIRRIARVSAGGALALRLVLSFAVNAAKKTSGEKACARAGGIGRGETGAYGRRRDCGKVRGKILK